MTPKKKAKKRASTPRPYNCGKMSESELRSSILQKLRLLTSRWRPKNKSIVNAKGKCAECWEIFKAKELKADHCSPIVPVEGWEKTDDLFLWYNWNEWLRNAFVETEGYQALCLNCHHTKTKEENKIRKQYKDSKKGT